MSYPSHTKQIDERFQNLIRQAPLGIIVLIGEDMIVDSVNDAYGMLIKRTAAELMGKPLFSIIPETEKDFKPILDKVRITGESIYLYDHPYFIIDQEEKKQGYLNLVYQPYKELNETTSGVMVLCQDVTEQVLNRKKTEESEQQLRSFVESAPFPIGVYTGAEMRIKLANQSIMDTWGKGNDVIGKLYADILPELDNQEIFEQLSHVFSTGIPFHAHNQRVDLMIEGKLQPYYFNYSFVPLKDAEGQVYGVMNTAADVTDLNLAKQKLEFEKERANLAMDAGELGLFEVELATDTIVADKRFNDIFGFKTAMTRNEYAAACYPDDLKIREDALKKAMQSGTVDYETRFIHTSGKIGWLKTKGYVIYDEEHKPYKLFGVVQEITEQKSFAQSLAQQVIERTSELKRSNEDLLQFAHVASHDLKEPVRKVKTFSSRLQEEYKDLLPEKGQSYLTKVLNATERMFSMIEGVLTYSTLNSADQPIEWIDLNNIIRDIESDLEVLIHQKNGTITNDGLPAIEGASVLIYQLFYNLINNSLKFSKDTENIHVHISSYCVNDGLTDYVKIIVSDNGIGFEPEYTVQLFNAFSRLNSKDKYEGTGLGLALCKRIVERHHGTIAAKGKKDEGATFTVMLPLKQIKN